jgi:indole-3-glycerol phosphate synthase
MILDDIVAQRRRRIREQAGRFAPSALERGLQAAPPVRDFRAALAERSARGALAVIAEIKKASPSAGMIAPDFHPVRMAQGYAASGAAALSVLTEPDFFLGADEDLRVARAACRLPVLRKDFLVDLRQVEESRTLGADGILLICTILDDRQLGDFSRRARELGMACLFEVHDEQEVRRAVDAGADLIGINNRDLRTFRVDLATFGRLRPMVPAGCLAVAESGVRTVADATRLRGDGADAVLVGEALMRAPDLGALLGGMLAGERT